MKISKKTLFIIIANIIILISILVFTDYFIAQKNYRAYLNDLKIRNSINFKKNPCNTDSYFYTLRLYPFNKIINNMAYLITRLNFADDDNTKSIIVFGCSFAEGSVKKNFEYLLSKKTKRVVFNFGYTGLGIANMYAQISSPIFEYFVSNAKPKYAIYIFISDHIYRLYSDKYGLKEQIYINDDIQPVNIKINLLRQLSRFYIGRILLEKYISNNKLGEKYNNKNFDLMKLYFKKSKEKLEKYYPNIKFIIIKYPSDIIGNSDWENELYNSVRWQELEQDGFKIIDLNSYINADLTNSKYTFDDGHPTSEAWEIITDKLSKDINNNTI